MKNKILILFLVLSLFASSTALCEESAGPSLLKKEDGLVSAMKRGEEKTLLKTENALLESPNGSGDQGSSISKNESTPSKLPSSSSSEEVLSLLNEVEALKTRVVVEKRNALSTQNPRARKKVGSKTYYSYQEGQIYEVHAGVDVVTDIELQAGETLTNAPVSGDTLRWKMTVLQSGAGDRGTNTHIILKPLEENLETNIIITTDKRTYHLRALSSNWYMPAVAWNYPDDEARELEAALKEKEKVEPLSLSPESLRFSYEISGGRFAWTPLRVFDDGKKTYIQMPPEIASSEAPALFVLEEDGEPQLVNYRVKGSYYIVDRLFERAQMRVGPKLSVEIRSENYKPSFWEAVF